MEIKATTTLSNGMYAVAGIVPEDGISIDVYKDATRDTFIFMEHGIISNVDDDNYKVLFLLAENRCKEMGL